jgi:hypothetical protein
MTGRLLLACALAFAPTRLSAQGSTTETLRQARGLYENLDVERALLLLRQVVSPSSPFEVTPAQRVEAYKYLGASLAFIGMRDSATVYFRAALERDPFTDLDPLNFTPDQLATFAQARRLTFSLGARQVAAGRLDPPGERMRFTKLSTQAASVRDELKGERDSVAIVLFNGDMDGLRDIPWNGRVAGDRLAAAGRYQLALAGQSRLNGDRDSAEVYFNVAHDHAPLEDTLPDLTPSELLPEERPAITARQALLTGAGVGASAFIISTLVSDPVLERDAPAFGAIAGGAGVISGLVSFAWYRSHRSIPANVQENQRRRAERAMENAVIRQGNDEKLAQTVLIISAAVAPPRQ